MEQSKRVCYKCQEKSSFYLHQEHGICKECFLKLVSRKYNSFLRSKMRALGKKLKYQCVITGSLNSLMLSDLFNTRYLITFNPKNVNILNEINRIIYVNFFALEKLFIENEEEMEIAQQKLNLLNNFWKEFQVDCVIINIEDYIDLKQTKQTLLKVKNLGGFKEDYLYNIERIVLLKYFEQNKPTHVMLPENSEQLSTRALKLICKKRRPEMVFECSGVYKYKDMTIGRPLIERSNKEVYYYLYSKDLLKFQFDKFDWVKKFYSKKELSLIGEGSINKLLSSFMLTLQSEYHSSSSTLLKTITKIEDELVIDENVKKCEICMFNNIQVDLNCIGCSIMFDGK